MLRDIDMKKTPKRLLKFLLRIFCATKNYCDEESNHIVSITWSYAQLLQKNVFFYRKRKCELYKTICFI